MNRIDWLRWAILAAVSNVASAALADDRSVCILSGGPTAIAACTRAIDSKKYSDKDLADLHLNRGMQNTYEGLPSLAMLDFDIVIRMRPDWATAYGDRSYALNRKRDFDQAIAEANKAIELNSRSVVGYSNRAFAWINKGQYDRAINDANTAIQLAPRRPAAYTHRGLAYIKKKAYDKALNDLNMAIKLSPDYARAFINRGILNQALQKEEDALADFAEAIRLDPKWPDTFEARSETYLARNAFDEALSDLNAAIALEGHSPRSYSLRAIAWNGQERYDRVVQDATLALAADANSVADRVLRGSALLHLGKNDEAIDDLSVAIRLRPRSAIALNNRGVAYENKKDDGRALADYSESLKADPKYVPALLNRARVYETTARLEEAKRDYQAALALDSQNSEGINGLRRIQTKLASASPKPAVEAPKPTPPTTYAKFLEGCRTTRRSDNLDTIVEACTRAIALDSTRPAPYLHRGEAYEGRGKKDDARHDFEKAATLEAKDDEDRSAQTKVSAKLAPAAPPPSQIIELSRPLPPPRPEPSADWFASSMKWLMNLDYADFRKIVLGSDEGR